jgi:SAM-dependent methyltransferase
LPTLDWLKKEFKYGYDSGDILSWIPSLTRYREERAVGASYRKVFWRAVAPYLAPTSRVLELGPGRGSWSRAILSIVTKGELHTVDYVDVSQWLSPEQYQGRLICHRVQDNKFDELPEGHFDTFWSFGVLCHNNIENIEAVLANARRKMKPGGVAIHQYGDWRKLESFGWKKGQVPEAFKSMPDQDIWWPRNNQDMMAQVSRNAGWTVVTPDLGLLARDSIIVLRNSAQA